MYVTVDVPGSLIGLSGVLPTSLRGINPAGDIVGFYLAPAGSSADCTLVGSPPCIKGFLLRRGKFSTVLFPGHQGSIPQRITPTGDIYGCYHDQDLMGSMFGFTRTPSATFAATDVPASMNNGATPDGSTVVGLYSDLKMMPPPTHAYVIQNGTFQSFDVPGSKFTAAWDINPGGNIVGEFRDLTAYSTASCELPRDTRPLIFRPRSARMPRVSIQRRDRGNIHGLEQRNARISRSSGADN
jgi:hypothetical protein